VPAPSPSSIAPSFATISAVLRPLDVVELAQNRLEQRDRLLVATSRAQCRVELVCSPRLLEADCKTPEKMTLVNALCRFVELAEA
jgi:hypothetical protein